MTPSELADLIEKGERLLRAVHVARTEDGGARAVEKLADWRAARTPPVSAGVYGHYLAAPKADAARRLANEADRVALLFEHTEKALKYLLFMPLATVIPATWSWAHHKERPHFYSGLAREQLPFDVATAIGDEQQASLVFAHKTAVDLRRLNADAIAAQSSSNENQLRAAVDALPGPPPHVLVVALENFAGSVDGLPASFVTGNYYALPRDRADEWIKVRYVLPVHPDNASLPSHLAAMVEHGLVVAHPDAPPPKTLPGPAAEAPGSSTAAAGADKPARPKRSSSRGDGRAKLIAALTKHHQYAEGGCLNLEPIGNNELAEAAGVSTSTASAFFTDQFDGHSKYKAFCRDAAKLIAALKLLNNEFAPHGLYAGRLAGEGDRCNG